MWRESIFLKFNLNRFHGMKFNKGMEYMFNYIFHLKKEEEDSG